MAHTKEHIKKEWLKSHYKNTNKKPGRKFFIYHTNNNKIILLKGNTKFWYGVMNFVQMYILESYAIQQKTMFVAVEIESSDEIVDNKLFRLYSALSRFILLYL